MPGFARNCDTDADKDTHTNRGYAFSVRSFGVEKVLRRAEQRGLRTKREFVIMNKAVCIAKRDLR